MTLHKTEHEALATPPVTVQAISAAPLPLVIPTAAFEISAAAFDELTRILRARGYDHALDAEKNCIIADFMAFTRGK